uniref:Uncharacterized protein n=1 Tax=Nelumbo nucifera TaxID=4432 RepID=A0A822ZJE4_NELNU|nr:TPA_asm: hypothetical protein HUJ06_003003 [Nelumbo nucifera]
MCLYRFVIPLCEEPWSCFPRKILIIQDD